jgi:hypothetical protein
MTFEEAYIRLDKVFDTIRFDMSEASSSEKACLREACNKLLDAKDRFKRLSKTSNDYSWEECDE